VRARKQPIHDRIAKAGAHRAEIVAAVAERPNDVNAVPAIAHELGHLSHQVAKAIEDVADYGHLPSATWSENLKKGSFFMNGQYFSINTLLASLAMMKASRLMHEPRKGSGIENIFLPDSEPCRVLYGCRVVGPGGSKREDDDVFALCNNTAIYSSTRSPVDTWPDGAIVFQGTIPHLAPDFRAFVKLFGAMFLISRDQLVLKLTSIFTERLGSFVGLGNGIDFAR
jgi:hypothetical protein